MRMRAAGMLAAGVLLCGGCDEAAPAPTASPDAVTAAAGCPWTAPGRAGAAATLRPGPSAGTPETTAVGEPLVIDAVVLDRTCVPAGGAPLRVWHTDARGHYGPGAATQRGASGGPSPAGGNDCCFHEATGATDHSGRFRLETVRPARYPEANAPPAHIHARIDHGGRQHEVTMVFGSGSPPATVTPASGPVVVPLSRDGAGWRGEAVLVLS